MANLEIQSFGHTGQPAPVMPGFRQKMRERKLSQAFYVLPGSDEELVKLKTENLVRGIDDDSPTTSLQVTAT